MPNEIRNRMGLTRPVIPSDLRVAAELRDRLIVEHRNVALGSVEALFGDPAHADTPDIATLLPVRAAVPA